MELSQTNGGIINDWTTVEQLYRSNELKKTEGRFLIVKHEMDTQDVEFVERYLKDWVGYCEETIFDLNLSIIDEENVMAISQNSLVYERLESLGIKVHKVPFRHRFFWDGGLHCITNDLVREK
jgi:arginine deiminase